MNNLSIRFSRLEAGYGIPVFSEGAVQPGKLTALIGPNGSGKTTLLRTFAGLLPYKGSLTFETTGEVREVSRIPRREMGLLVGMVPQQVQMAAPFTVYDAVALGRLPHRSRGDDRLVLEAAADADVEHLLFRRVTRLSTGEAQRVLLAAVLAQDPSLLLLDEPTSAQDPHQTAKVFSLLKRVAGSGKTVVAAVHDVNLAVVYADVFLALKKSLEGEMKDDVKGEMKDVKESGFPLASPVERLDGEVLERIYGVPFDPYVSPKGAKVWHTRVN
ncbi:MAG: ABC transporter ATP-binding protein [Synergistaceae bacterium]|jgi:iron complex transport system ATP-binding protein|nr:ABC transporter ATP-binding protein [Synergistaceae bacterium]